MLRYQVLLITVLICTVTFMACDSTQDMLEEVMMDPEADMMGPDETMEMVMEMAAHHSWASVDLEAPMMTVAEAAAAMNAAGTGAAHTPGARTVYFNDVAAMANMAEGDKMYPAGSMIIKEVYGVDDMVDKVVHVASMTKTEDPMYAERGGWIYGVNGNNFSLEASVGCDECHAKAGEGNDYVFVSLMKDEEGMTEEGMTEEGMTEEGMTEEGTGNGNGNRNGNGI